MTQRETMKRTIEQLQASNPTHSAWVLANAGSGKTYVLVDRVVRLMLAGAAPQSILCLTFTKAAAAEMSSRLFEMLSGWIGRDDPGLREFLHGLGEKNVDQQRLARARQLFALAIETPGGLKIQTIHAFCEKLLHLFPVESGLAPGFRVMDETDRLALLRRATERALAEAAAEGDKSILLLEDGGITTRDGFEDLAKRFLSATSELRNAVDESFELAALDGALRGLCGIGQFASTGEIEDHIRSMDWAGCLKAGQDLAQVGPYYDRDIGALLRSLANAEAFDSRVELLIQLVFSGGKPRSSKRYFSKRTEADFPTACEFVKNFVDVASSLLPQRALSQKIEATTALITLMRRVYRRFMALKSAEGLYDFDDLIMRTSALLTDSAAAQWVLYKLDGNLSHILVDEAQDTSPTQWQIIRSLADEFFAGSGRPRKDTRTVFVVGDSKQSIYSFQGADVLAFEDARRHFDKRLTNAGQQLQDVRLKVSYRSLKAVLQMVDLVFSKGSAASGGLGDDAIDMVHEPNRKGEGTFELWPLFKPLPEEERDTWKAPVNHVPDNAPRRRLARHLATTIKSWVGKRLLMSQNRLVVAGDILILLQSRNSLFDALIAELRKLGVAVAGADRLKLRENIAVLDLMALAQVCCLPDDDLSLACVLKSPMVPEPLDDAALTDLAATRQANLWSTLQQKCAGSANLLWLEECRSMVANVGPHGFLSCVLTRFRKAMQARLGDEALDATDTLLDVALTFEREESTSLAAFLHWFMAREDDVKRELEQDGGQLRIMTVHGAKGLQSNIVILPDAADIPGPKSGASLLTATVAGNVNLALPFFNMPTEVKPTIIETWRDGEKQAMLAEKKRLLYVAMTRAKDELYITGTLRKGKNGEAPSPSPESWYGLITQSFENADENRVPRDVADNHPEGVIKRWGADPVYVAGDKTDGSGSEEPVLPQWMTSAAPHAARRRQSFGLSALAQGGNAFFDRTTAERGLAIHALLEHLDSDTPLVEVQRRAAKRNLEPDLAKALHDLVQRPDVSHYFASHALTEASISGTLDGFADTIQGRVDRLLVTPAEIWLLDYKSGRMPPQTPEHFLRQMAGYVAILAAAYPGRKINAALLWTQGGALQVLDPRTLSRVLDQMRVERVEVVA